MLSVQSRAQCGGISLYTREDIKPNTAMIAEQSSAHRNFLQWFMIHDVRADHPDVPAIIHQHMARG